ncbi:MAG: hypothetical protein F4X66_15340 [Chloroflexi bacterium]|nr:hypothetical protein [Chloroflexota bacterium]MYE40225.1 hypothetical protein [Chloroflexota bacterium]
MKEYHFHLAPGETNELPQITIRADRIESHGDEEEGRRFFQLYRNDELVGAVAEVWVRAWWIVES